MSENGGVRIEERDDASCLVAGFGSLTAKPKIP